MKLAPLLPMTKLSREPAAGDELEALNEEIDALPESDSPPALDPPEYYQVDDRLIEVWRLSAGPVVVEFRQVEVPEARAALKEKLHDMVELGLDVDRLPQWEIEETSEVSRIFAGYPTEDAARADGRRLLLEAAMRSPELRFMTGWDRDALLLVRGLDWYTIRTHADGSIEYEANEEPLNAHMTYAEMGGRLARDLEYDVDFGSELGPFARKVASAFVHREAANALLAQARQSLRVTMEGIDRVEQAGGAPVNIAELARKLYTDRSNLYKLMPSRESRRRR